MKARIGRLVKLNRLRTEKTCFQLKNGRFLTSFRGVADTKPSTPINYDLHALAQ